MKIARAREVIVLTLIGYTVFLANEKLLPNIDLSVPETDGLMANLPVEETQSSIWFISHRDEAQKRVEECRKDKRLTHMQNCINAEFAIKALGG